MERSRWIIIWTVVALLIFAPPALLLFGRWERQSKRDRENREAFDRPAPAHATPPSGADFLPESSTPGELRKFGQGALVRCLSVSPDRRSVIVGGTDNNVTLWSLSANSSTTFSSPYAPLNAVAFFPDAQRVFVGPNGVPFIWDFRNSQMQYISVGSADQIDCLAIAPNGYTAVTGSNRGAVRVWNIQTLSEIGIVAVIDESTPVIAVAYSADGQRVQGANDVGHLGVWDLKTGQLVMSRRHLLPWRKGVFSPDGKFLLTGSPDGNIGLYDIENNGNQLRRFKAHHGIIHGVAFSPDGSHFATASGTEVTLWKTANATKISTLRLPQQSVNGAIAVLHTNQHILFGGNGLSLALMPPEQPAGAVPSTRPASAD